MKVNIVCSSMTILRTLYNVKAAKGDLEVILSFSRRENWRPERKSDVLKMLSLEPSLEAVSLMCLFHIAWRVSSMSSQWNPWSSDRSMMARYFPTQPRATSSHADLNLYCAHGLLCLFLGTRQCAGFPFSSLLNLVGFVALEWSGMNNHPQHLQHSQHFLATKQHFLEMMNALILTACWLLQLIIKTNDWRMTYVWCPVRVGTLEMQKHLFYSEIARQAGCPSLAWCCRMSLHYFSLFESLAVSGVGWAPRPFLSVMRDDHKEAVEVWWGLLNTSSIFSIPVSGYRQYHLEGRGSWGCTKAVTHGII